MRHDKHNPKVDKQATFAAVARVRKESCWGIPLRKQTSIGSQWLNWEIWGETSERWPHQNTPSFFRKSLTPVMGVGKGKHHDMCILVLASDLKRLMYICISMGNVLFLWVSINITTNSNSYNFLYLTMSRQGGEFALSHLISQGRQNQIIGKLRPITTRNHAASQQQMQELSLIWFSAWPRGRSS